MTANERHVAFLKTLLQRTQAELAAWKRRVQTVQYPSDYEKVERYQGYVDAYAAAILALQSQAAADAPKPFADPDGAIAALQEAFAGVDLEAFAREREEERKPNAAGPWLPPPGEGEDWPALFLADLGGAGIQIGKRCKGWLQFGLLPESPEWARLNVYRIAEIRT